MCGWSHKDFNLSGWALAADDFMSNKTNAIILWRYYFTSTFLDAVLISMATARHTTARDNARLVAVDWARLWRILSHHGDTASPHDDELSLSRAPVKNPGENKYNNCKPMLQSLFFKVITNGWNFFLLQWQGWESNKSFTSHKLRR